MGLLKSKWNKKGLYFNFFENKLNISKIHFIVNDIKNFVYYKINSIGAYRY